MGPEQGQILPGMTVVCGDSHTATHGALGRWLLVLASEVEHVLATQCLRTSKSKNMLEKWLARLAREFLPRTLFWPLLGLSVRGATGHVIEYAGEVFQHEHGRAHDSVQYEYRSRCSA